MIESYTVIDARPHRCDRWACCKCCVHKGLALRDKVIPVVRTFKNRVMLTCTLDPKLHSSSKDAWKYCSEKRIVSEVVRSLDKWGLLYSNRYFVVTEFQEDTEMPHFHVILDAKPEIASRENHRRLSDRYNLFRPKDAGPIEEGRPGFGFLWLSYPKGKKSKKWTPEQAVGYVTSYLIKQPKYGQPDWYLDLSDKEFHRYSASRGFFGSAESPEDVEEQAADDQPSESLEVGPNDDGNSSSKNDTRQRGTIREALLKCRQSIKVFRRTVHVFEGGEVLERSEYLKTIPVPFHVVSLNTAVDLFSVGKFGGVTGRNLVEMPEEDFEKLKWVGETWEVARIKGKVPEHVGCPNADRHPDRIAERDAWIQYEKECEKEMAKIAAWEEEQYREGRGPLIEVSPSEVITDTAVGA